MTWRAAALAAVVLALTIMWSAPSVVHVEGRVTMTSCPGNPPKGLPPYCSTHPVEGATVMLAPTHGEVITATTVADGRYRMDVSPGRYVIAASGTEPVPFATQPSWVTIPAQPSIRLDIGAPSMAI